MLHSRGVDSVASFSFFRRRSALDGIRPDSTPSALPAARLPNLPAPEIRSRTVGSSEGFGQSFSQLTFARIQDPVFVDEESSTGPRLAG